MGCGHSKITSIYPRKSKTKGGSGKRAGAEADSDEDAEEADRGVGGAGGGGGGGGGGEDSKRKVAVRGRQTISSGPLLAQTEMSSSQMDFFRMLDEKIESGPDYDSGSEEEMAMERARICSLLRDWETASLNQSAPSTPRHRKAPQLRAGTAARCLMNGEVQYVPYLVTTHQPQAHHSVVQYRSSRGTYTELA